MWKQSGWLGMGLCLLSCASAWGASGLVLGGLSKASHTQVAPGKVLILEANVSNVGDEVEQGQLRVSVEGFPSIQSGRRLSLQPGEQRTLPIYFQLPQEIAGQPRIEITGVIYVEYQGREVILDRDGQPATYNLTLQVAEAADIAAMVLEPAPLELPLWFWPNETLHATYEMFMAGRIDSGNSRLATGWDQQLIPLSLVEWENIASLAISDASFFRDAAAIESAKHFLHRGGRLHVMLDRVGCEVVRPLLGTDQVCELVDQVALNEFEVEISGTLLLSEEDRSVSLDEAVTMSRVAQTGGQVTHKVNGWPAAIVMPVGRGRLILTTLESRAWIEERSQQVSQDLRYQAPFTFRPWGTELAAEIHAGSAEQPLQQALDYPRQLIGKPIVARSRIVLALGLFCGALTLLVGWRAVAGDLQMLGALVPTLAVVVSAGLLVVSTWVRREISEGVFSLQLVEVAEGGALATVHEQSAVYLTRGAAMTLRSEVDGIATADQPLSSGIQRFLMDDFQRWELSNTAWPPGSWRYSSEYRSPAEGLEVQAELTSDGVRMHLPQSLPSRLEDPVLAYSVGDLMLCEDSEDGLESDGSLSVLNNRWIADTLVSDEQARRSEIYQRYFEVGERGLPPQQTLFGWTELWAGPSWDRSFERRGSALVSLPVRLLRPPPEREVYVPHGLLQLRRNRSQLARTPAFDDRTGRWTPEMSLAIEGDFQFVLPAAIIPFEAESLELELDVRAPQRTVRVVVPTSQGPVELVTLDSPSVPWRAVIDDAAVLEQARDGVLDIVVRVSERSAAQGQAATVVTWQIDYFHASLRGHVAPVSQLESFSISTGL